MTTKSIATSQERNLAGSNAARPYETRPYEIRAGDYPNLLRRQRSRASFSMVGGFVLIFAGAFFAPTFAGTAPQLWHLPFAAAALLGFGIVVNSIGSVTAKTRLLRQVQSDADTRLEPGARNSNT